jgi:hypothetical protein
MRSIALTALTVLWLGGCALVTPLPSFETRPGDRIGIVVQAGDSPTHKHIGTTVFNNFEKKYGYPWRLDATLTAQLTDALTRRGFVVVDLEKEGVSPSELVGLVTADGQKWSVASGKEPIVQDLKDRRKLRAVLTLTEGSVMVSQECGPYGCAERFANSAGLFTRSFLGSTNYFATPALRLNFYLLDPPADLGRIPAVRQRMVSSVQLANFPDPVDFQNMTEAELAPARDAVLNVLNDLSNGVAEALRPPQVASSAPRQ